MNIILQYNQTKIKNKMRIPYFSNVGILPVKVYIRILYISMLNIEDLIRQLFASPLFKDQLQTHVKSCIEQQEQPLHQTPHTVYVPELVDEINGYITQITEIALQEENSKNYFAFIKKNEALCLELEKKINAKIQNSVQQIDSKIQALTLRLNEMAKNTKRTIVDGHKLRDERKMITQSILQTSRLQNASTTFTTLHHTKSQLHFGKETNSFEDLPQSNQTNSSMSMQFEKQKLGEIEKECKKCLQAWWTKVETSLDCLKKQHEKLKEECKELSEKTEMKLDGNLESLWNVISDLCSRISKFESMESLGQLTHI